MTHTQAIVLGAVQGLTEFLPVSSTAHLVIVPYLMNWPDPGLAFDVALHIGTLLALLLVFWRDFWQLGVALWRSLVARDWAHDPHQRMVWCVIVGMIPAGVVGLLAKHWIETSLRSPYVIVVTLIGFGLLLYGADVYSRKERDEAQFTLIDAVVIGLLQCLALIPGPSRSGITITAGLLRHLRRDVAARYSFLMSTPLVAAAAALGVKDLAEMPPGGPATIDILLGIAVSAVVGWLGIRWLLAFLAKRTNHVFVVWRVLLGLLILATASGLGPLGPR
jgi:undecaprenyl-diphosphatase